MSIVLSKLTYYSRSYKLIEVTCNVLDIGIGYYNMSSFDIIAEAKTEQSRQQIPMIALNNGELIPQIGLGTRKCRPGEMKKAVIAAIKCGYRHIDNAWIYANEVEVGEAINECVLNKIVTRSEMFVTSKLWNTFHGTNDVEPALRSTLKALNLDYVDLYLIHWPVTGVECDRLTPSIEETWKAMERLVELRLTKSIGVSNWSVSKLQAMIPYATIFPAVNQVEVHPHFRQDELIRQCNAMGVHVTAYSPLGSPDAASMIQNCGCTLIQHPVICAIAMEINRSPGQVLIRWSIQRGTSVIPKSVNPDRILENITVLDFQLSNDHMNAINTVFPQVRIVQGHYWIKQGGPYKTLEDLWC